MTTTTVYDHQHKVHHSLMKRDLTFGLSTPSFMLLAIITVLFVLGFEQYWFLAVTAALFIFMRFLTAKDDFLIDIVLDTILLPDSLEL